MALLFSGTTQRVVVTDSASFQNQAAFSVLMWVKPTTQTVSKRFFRKNVPGDNEKELAWGFNDANDVDFSVARDSVNANLRTNVNFANNTWTLFGCTYDETDGGRIFYQLLGGEVLEATYATRNVGSGATTNDNGSDLIIGNREAFDQAFQGNIATFHWINKRLSLGEIIQQADNIWFPLFPETAIFINLGFNSTGSQRDWSGNGNNGTVTGAVVAAHPPLSGQVPMFVRPAFVEPPVPPGAIMNQMQKSNLGADLFNGTLI
jgi:hypothetical protein